jgi:hypothetical protein
MFQPVRGPRQGSLYIGIQVQKMQRCACVELNTIVLIKITKNFQSLNQLTYVFYNSKRCLIFHCRQISISIFVIFIQRKYPYVVWWCLCRGVVVPKVCPAYPKGSATSSQGIWGHSCNGCLEVYLFFN